MNYSSDTITDGNGMTFSCDTIKDLLPLYVDNVCSEDTKNILQAHLATCPTCRDLYEKMKNETVANQFHVERDEVVSRHNKQVKRKSATIGIAFAAILMVPIIVTLIVNLAVGRTLDWFFIVLTSLLVLASVTVVPLMAEGKKILLTIGSFTVSLLLLLMTVAIFTGGNWFFLAAVPTLFGLQLVFGPMVLTQLPQTKFLKNRKGLVYMIISTVMLYLTILTAGLYSFDGTSWRIAWSVTSITLIIPWFMFLIIRYLRTNRLIKAGICLIFSGVVFSLINSVVNWIIDGIRGTIRLFEANLALWNSDAVINANIDLITLLTCVILGMIFIGIGIKVRIGKGHN